MKANKFEGATARIVWGAVAYADRMNKQRYVKHDRVEYRGEDINGEEIYTPPETANRTYAYQAVENPALLTDADYEFGETIHTHFHSLSFKALSGKLNDFEKTVLKMVDLTDWETNRQSAYYFAVACSLASSYRRDVARTDIDARIRFSGSEHFGKLKERMTMNVEILRKVYSQKWETYYITALVNDGDYKGNVVFYAYSKGGPEKGVHSITGTIKAHRSEGQTQLNRVRLNK